MSGLIKILVRLWLVKIIANRWKSDRPPSSTFTGGAGASVSQASTRAVERRSGSGGRGGIPPQKAGGPGPDTPLELEKGDWRSTFKRTLKEIKEDRATLASAGMAYYFTLSVFPALIALAGILNLVDVDTGRVVEAIRSALPDQASQVLIDTLNNAQRPSENASLVATIVGIALALWSASSGMVALQSGLNIAYDVPSDRKFIGKRAVALALIIATGLLGAFPSPFFAFGEGTVFTVVGVVLSAIAVVLLFSIYYYLAPNRESPKWQWVSVGGIVGALIWILASVGFRYYVEYGTSYNETYGTAAGLIILVLWLFITSLSVLIGGELNAELERQGERRRRRESTS